MLLRSSSTPLVHQSHFSNTTPHHSSFTATKPSSINDHHHHHHHHLTSFSSISQSNPTSITTIRRKSLRRAQSDTNLHQPFSSPFDSEQFLNSNTLTSRSLNTQAISMLRTEPSFCIYNSEDGSEEFNQNKVQLEGLESGEFSFGKKDMGLIEEDNDEGDEEGRVLNGIRDLDFEEQVVEPASPPMYLATGFGIDGNGIGGGGDLKMVLGDDKGDLEEYYKRMLNEDPSNPLFLRNYAELLQSKGDLLGAEEYYFRATLADPKDGEILMQYAKLVWELHHDHNRAMSYFESAARASPQDSHILAAYASFLWEIDEDFTDNDQIQIKEDDSRVKLQNPTFEEVERPVSPPLHLAAGLGIDMAGFGGPVGGIDYSAPLFREGENVEEYYKRMVKENPCNPLFLRNYAQFLSQSKGDLEGAEEYYSRAILADPTDGDVISQYAKLVWQLHHDHGKASSYFEQAVRATPADCNVLAAYAGFLWETEEDEEEHSGGQDHIEVPVFQGQDITPTHA